MNKRVLIWDIESTNLEMDFATILAIGWKWLGEKKTTVFSILDPESKAKDAADDKGLVKRFLDVYSQADLTVTYYGAMFDKPAIITKALEHRLPLPPNVPMVDLYFTAKSNLKISSRRLAVVQEYLGLKTEKTAVLRKVWKKARIGDAKAIQYIVDHCKKDVVVLEEAYNLMRPLVRTHFRLSDDLGHCRFCNGSKLQSRGRSISKAKGEQRRVQCSQCGGWDTRTLREVKKYRL